MSFRITGLDAARFRDLHALPDEALAEKGVRRVRIEQKHAAPCRISSGGSTIAAPGSACRCRRWR